MPQKKKNPKKPNKITFNYIKTPSYRTYHVDGFYGGLTAKGNLYVELFVERAVTPQKEIYEIKGNALMPNPKREGKEGVVREIEAGMIMDYPTMLIFKKWLDEKINQHQSIIQNPTKN